MTKTNIELALASSWTLWLIYGLSSAVTGMIYTRGRNYSPEVKPKKMAMCVLFGVVWFSFNVLCSVGFVIWVTM